MPTDTERREVARRLRSLRKTNPGVTSLGHGYLWSLLWAVSGEELGESNRDHWFERMCSRIADLIEPPTQCPYYHSDRHYCSIHDVPATDRDTPQKAAEEMFGKMRHSTKEEADAYDAMLKSKSVELHPVDRDALLELADELEQETGSVCGVCMGKTARRIREALGVEC